MSRATVDMARCQGHGQCVMMAPDVFDLDDDGYVTVLVDEVPEDAAKGVRVAVEACPEQALAVEG